MVQNDCKCLLVFKRMIFSNAYFEFAFAYATSDWIINKQIATSKCKSPLTIINYMYTGEVSMDFLIEMTISCFGYISLLALDYPEMESNKRKGL